MHNTVALLADARARTSMPENWTQEAYARIPSIDVEPGQGCTSTDARAECWCATGTIARSQKVPIPVWSNALRNAF